MTLENQISLDNRQVRIILWKIRVGRQIKKVFPEIAEDFRKGEKYRDIVVKYDLVSEFNIPEEVALGAIKYAIRGYNRELGAQAGEPYEGLVEDSEELKKLTKKRLVNTGKGIYERGVGIFTLTTKQLRAQGHKTGTKMYDEKKGMFARTPEQIREHLESISDSATIAKGFVPWDDDETRCAYRLSQQEIRNEAIADKINKTYHDGKPVRSAGSLNTMLWRLKKKS